MITITAPPSIHLAVKEVTHILTGCGIIDDARAAVQQAALDWDANQIHRTQAALVKAGDPPTASRLMRMSFVVNEVSCRIANAVGGKHPAEIMLPVGSAMPGR